MNDEHNLSFDAQAENKAIIDLNYYFTKYNMSNEELRNALLRYTNNDTYKGDDATASKEYIATREIGFIDDTLKMQQKLMHLYIHKSETFAEKVDPDPYARIDTVTLDEIQSDLRRLYYIFEGYDREFAAIADDLQERYGHICNFTKPNGKPVLESLAAICGGDNPESGSIYETKQAFIKWNEEECVYANSVMLSDDMVDFKWNLYETDEMLAGIKDAEPSISAKFISKITKKTMKKPKGKRENAMIPQKAVSVEEMYDILQKEYGFTEDEMEYLKANYPGLLKTLYNAKNKSTRLELNTYDKLQEKLFIRNYRDILIASGWSEENVSDEMLIALRRTLIKYNIRTKEQICMFLAECSHESGCGRHYTEQGPKNNQDQYFANKPYGKKYRGAGALQITWEYQYQAFATYEILEKYPKLKEYASFSNPAHGGTRDSIKEQYDAVISAAADNNIDVSRYTAIVSEGADYVAENFAWEVSGYFWEINHVNKIIDKGASIDDISEIINKYDTDSFEKREKYYNAISDAYDDYY